MKALPLRSETRQGGSLSTLLFNIVVEVLASAINQDKEIKGNQIRKEKSKIVLSHRQYTSIIICVENLMEYEENLLE